MGKTYYLDLQTLITYLQGQTCLLKTAMGKGTGYISLHKGKVTRSYIQEGQRIILEGQQAFERLAKRQEWKVQFVDPDPATPTAPQLSPSLPPFREQIQQTPLVLKRGVGFHVLNAFQPQDRPTVQMVLSLINGQRTVTDLKLLLRLPASLIDEVLAALRTLDVLE